MKWLFSGNEPSTCHQYPYRFLYLKNMKTDNPSAISSAAGVASQTPFTPKNKGSTIIVINMNTKDLENARTAETTPLDNAVNIPLANILNPMNRSAMVHIRFPVTARPYTGLSGRANMDTNGFVSRKDAATVTSEIPAITFRLVVTSFFIFSWFCSP